MKVKEYMCKLAREIAADNRYGYSNDWPDNRFGSDATPFDGDCGAFCSWVLHLALLKIGIDTGSEYYEPQGGWNIYNEAFLLRYMDRYGYTDVRNEPADIVINGGHTEMITSVYESNGKWYDEITGARNDYDDHSGDSSGNEISTIPFYESGWHYIYRLKEEFNKEIGDPEPEPGNKFVYGEFDELWPCEKGDQGGHVISLQSVLNSKYNYYDGNIDGDFGEMTEEAVKRFQNIAGLYVDGQCGPKTWYTLLCSNVVL